MSRIYLKPTADEDMTRAEALLDRVRSGKTRLFEVVLSESQWQRIMAGESLLFEFGDYGVGVYIKAKENYN